MTVTQWIADNKFISAMVAAVPVFMAFMGLIEKVTGKKNIAGSFWKGIARFAMFPLNTNNRFDKLEKQNTNLFDTVVRIEIGLMDIQQTTLAFLDMQDVAYWISNDKGEAVQISKALCEIFERSESEIKNNNWVTFLHPDDKDIFEEWKHSIDEKRLFNSDYQLKKRDGKYVKVNGFAVHKLDHNRKYMGSIGRIKVI